MSPRKEAINKISRPRPPTVYARQRLFGVLDNSRRYPVVWVSAPAGAGKTTLVSSYLESRHLACLWYQIDSRDADPATFFHYMSLAVKQACPRRRKPLPQFSPEFMPGIETFALRYFETVYQRLPTPTIVVMDNYQLIPSESILHGLLHQGLSIIPAGMTVILISREGPPPHFSRMLANRKMAHIGWNQIRLTRKETAGIAQMQTAESLSHTTIDHLHQTADGWAAGLMLILAQADLESIDWKWIQGFTPKNILDYFAKEVFERQTSEIQDFLLRAAFLPHMTIHMASTITGQTRAAQILSELNRGNRFTERRFRKRLSYQFHPLFRDFLLSRAKEIFSEDEWAKLCNAAAVLLQDEGDPEAAAVLLRDARGWDALAGLIMRHALILMRQGRSQTILQWIRYLPKDVVADTPWLEFWKGTSLMTADPEAGRYYLEKAFDAFRCRKDSTGSFLSWSFIIRAVFLKMTDMSPFDRWIQTLEELMDAHPQFPVKEIEGHVVAGMLLALGHRQMHHPDIASWVDRALALLSGPLDMNIKVSLVNNAVHYYLLTGNYGKAAQIIDLLNPATATGQNEPKETVAIVAYSLISSFYYCYTGMHQQCIDVVSKGLDLAKKTGFIILNNVIAGHGIWSALIHEEYAAAKALFETNAEAIVSARPLDRGLIDFVRSLEALGLGNLTQASAYAASALKASRATGSQFSTIFCHLLNARVMHEAGHPQAADEHLNEAFHLSQLTRTKHFMFHALMLKARVAIDREQVEDGLNVLRKALELGNTIGLYHHMIDSRSAIARLCVVALENGIEVDYVTNYIRKRTLVPDIPPVHLENWPWPLKIFTLGRFSLVKEGTPIRFSTKAQKKPLEMIKVLIAFGGRDVNKGQISDALWPDADGDKAERAFATTLHRLRRLLDNDHALQIQDGRLSLNPACCWVDCWTFERLLSQAEAASKSNEMAHAIAQIDKALPIYKGAFLAGDTTVFWAVSPRERLRSKFLLAVNRRGSDLMATGQWERAAAYYRRSLDVDDLAEETYQRLMQCLQHMGRKTDALSVYDRCRHTLHAAFDLEPSSETRAIYRSLMDGR